MINIKKYLYKIIIIISILILVLFTYYNIFISHNYHISYEVPCNPFNESCFIRECNEETSEDCADENLNKYYKVIERKVFNSFKCEKDDYACLTCPKYEIDCNTVICDSSLKENNCSDLNNIDENF